MGMRNVNKDRKMLPKNWGVYAFRSWSYGIIIEISLPSKKNKNKKNLAPEDCPDGPVVKTSPIQRVQVWSLVRELRSHMPYGWNKTLNRSNVVTNSIKILKNDPHQKTKTKINLALKPGLLSQRVFFFLPGESGNIWRNLGCYNWVESVSRTLRLEVRILVSILQHTGMPTIRIPPKCQSYQGWITLLNTRNAWPRACALNIIFVLCIKLCLLSPRNAPSKK